MNNTQAAQAGASETQAKRRVYWRSLLRLLGLTVLVCILLLSTLWAAAALYFDTRVPWLRLPLAAAYLLGILVMWFWAKGRWCKAGLTACGVAFVLVWWFSLRPSNDRDWQPDVAVLPYAEI